MIDKNHHNWFHAVLGVELKASFKLDKKSTTGAQLQALSHSLFCIRCLSSLSPGHYLRVALGIQSAEPGKGFQKIMSTQELKLI